MFVRMGEGTLVFISLLWTIAAGLSHDGCDDGWVALHHHCYYFGVLEGDVTPAISACSAKDAHLASLWGGEERDFVVDKLWKPEAPRDGFVWHGLYGTADNDWAWRDGSDYKPGHLATAVSGSSGNKTNKCGALKGIGNYAFLDCTMDAQAYVCKKALSMVYSTSSIANHSAVSDHFQLFERLVPPVLSALPSASLQIAQIDVASETGCAYYCFTLETCSAFQYTCVTASACKTYTCKLLHGM
ncbi:killer cell lectin-like receptor subfamily G member 1 [Haliotis rufescens]|uniref:killer cell lectin-like receptor subfamily G member 1 n=1 Tax=Haliotis rufescens TaxID=6454 RepID=UPI00201F7DC9|nr:killer cell lectin-like receptor subfamily G member 1 [Haliotis rufescens]